jgi:hypothetical protein
MEPALVTMKPSRGTLFIWVVVVGVLIVVVCPHAVSEVREKAIANATAKLRVR